MHGVPITIELGCFIQLIPATVSNNCVQQLCPTFVSMTIPVTDQQSSPPDSASSEISAGLRTLISLLLVVQLFAIAVIVLAHTGQSDLTQQIRSRVPFLQPYMRRVWMDHTYTYSDYVNPQHGVRLDSQYAIEVQYKYADGTTNSITLPDDSLRPATRRRRYSTLARNFADLVGSDIEAQYAGMLAAGLLAEEPEAVSLQLACVERFTPAASDEPPDDLQAVRGEDGVYSIAIYRCQAWVSEEDGSTEIRKVEEARRLAPVTKSNER